MGKYSGVCLWINARIPRRKRRGNRFSQCKSPALGNACLFFIVTDIVDLRSSQPVMLMPCGYSPITAGSETVIMHYKKYRQQYTNQKKYILQMLADWLNNDKIFCDGVHTMLSAVIRLPVVVIGAESKCARS